jgi:hypothetical protein
MLDRVRVHGVLVKIRGGALLGRYPMWLFVRTVAHLCYSSNVIVSIVSKHMCTGLYFGEDHDIVAIDVYKVQIR